jgi:hypothetical protein
MFQRTKLKVMATVVFAAAGCWALQPSASARQTSGSAAKGDRWLHVRVTNSDAKGEVVRVNVPLDLAESVLPTINKEHLHNGKVTIDQAHLNDVDVRALMNAVRSAKDGEYVTVQSTDEDVRVAKQGGHLLVHVNDKGKHDDKGKSSQVEIKIPMHVIDALLSAGKDELDVVAALHALSQQGDTELVSVKDNESTVRIWLDSKNGD